MFLVDTSPSMLRRFRMHSSVKKPEEFIGGSPFTLLDAAKAAVEETVRVFSQQRPRYALFTTPIDPLHCLQVREDREIHTYVGLRDALIYK